MTYINDLTLLIDALAALVVAISQLIAAVRGRKACRPPGEEKRLTSGLFPVH